MSSGKKGRYEWYTLDDLIIIKDLILSDDNDKYIDGISMLIDMAFMTRKYAGKLDYYERLYIDDGK